MQATHTKPGFKVTRSDGHTTFHRVPIFAECKRGDLVFDAEWIRKAVAEAKLGERSGHLPPLHTRHHEPATEQTDAVRSVGVFRILEAAPLTFKGKRITAVFADLIVTDTFFASELERMRYPYRSVELFDPEGPPKINGLALLDHEAPYLELPMLMAGEVDDQTTDDGVSGATFAMSFSRKTGNPLLGSFKHGGRATLLFKFPDQVETMEENKNMTDEEKAAKLAADASSAANLMDEGDGHAKDDASEMEDFEGDTMDVSSIVKAIEAGTISVADMDAIIAAIQNQGGESEPEEEPAEAAPAPAPGAEIMKAKADQVNFARLAGENEALKARLDTRDADDARRDAVANAMQLLEGKPLGADLETRLVNFHKKAGGNAELFKEYVDTMAQTIGTLPDDDTGENFAAQHGKTPALAMKYQNSGGNAVDRAAHFCREYDELKGHGMRASQASYVATQLRREGIELAEAS